MRTYLVLNLRRNPSISFRICQPRCVVHVDVELLVDEAVVHVDDVVLLAVVLLAVVLLAVVLLDVVLLAVEILGLAVVLDQHLVSLDLLPSFLI